MRRLFLILSVMFVEALPALYCQTPVRRLQDVKTIYVLPLHGENAAVAELLSAKLISYLTKSRSISVTETVDNADAILICKGLTQTTTNNYGHVSYHIQGAIRLDNKDGLILWAEDVTSSQFASSATSSFAENVAKKLTQAIAESERR